MRLWAVLENKAYDWMAIKKFKFFLPFYYRPNCVFFFEGIYTGPRNEI